MNGKKSSVKIVIAGEEFAIRSDSSPERTRAVGDHVDQAIRSVLSSGGVVDPRKAAILAALQITDELFAARESSDELSAGMRALSADIRRHLPPAKRVSGDHPAR